ncbi:MAG: hypothetical protein WCI73_18135, partial [Phycisphaerae bacterium]
MNPTLAILGKGFPDATLTQASPVSSRANLPGARPLARAVSAVQEAAHAGWQAEQNGQLNRAAELYELALSFGPHCPAWAAVRAAVVQHVLGHHEAALLHWETLLPQNSADALVHALLLRRSGRPRSAGILLRREIQYWMDAMTDHPAAGDHAPPASHASADRVTDGSGLTYDLRRVVMLLKHGKFDAGKQLLISLRERLEWLLAAHGQWLLAVHELPPGGTGGEGATNDTTTLQTELAAMLAALGAMMDLLVRCDTRACLGQQLVTALQDQKPLAELAVHAVNETQVDDMLAQLDERLNHDLTETPGNVLWTYQRGLVAGARHDLPAATSLWRQVLALVPGTSRSGGVSRGGASGVSTRTPRSVRIGRSPPPASGAGAGAGRSQPHPAATSASTAAPARGFAAALRAR